MTRYYYDVAVGKLFKLTGALFMVLPYDWELGAYFNVCVCSKNPLYEVGNMYEFLDDTPVVEVDEKILEQLNSLLDS